MTEAETVPTVQPGPNDPSEVVFENEEHCQKTASEDDGFEGLKIQDEQRDVAIDCKSTDHSGDPID